MDMTEAANRLTILAEAFHGGRVETKVSKYQRVRRRRNLDLGVRFDPTEDDGYLVSALELEAVTTAAAILNMFVEALAE